MASDYAIKSIALIDFMNVTDIASRSPFFQEIHISTNAK
jgi:hypothetical protein